MTDQHPLVKIAADLARGFQELGRAWETAEEAIDDDDDREALHQALCEKYPYRRDVDELAVEAAEWADHVEEVMARPPRVLQLVANEITADVEKVAEDLVKAGTKPADDAYRSWQNGGLGGEVGRFGGVFTPSIAEQLAALLLAVHSGELQQITTSAEQLARGYRAASRNSHA